MYIIVGLGNPGKKFEGTRHNAGFIAINRFAGKNNLPEFKLQKKYFAEISEGFLGQEKIILAKPQTFMNESGKAVQKILSSAKDQILGIIVMHDDIDLPVGKIKIVQDRGSAGHKGVESIIKAIGNEGLIRIRIGIAPSNNVEAKKIVLKNFTKEEQEAVGKAIDKACQATLTIIEECPNRAMNEYN